MSEKCGCGHSKNAHFQRKQKCTIREGNKNCPCVAFMPAPSSPLTTAKEVSLIEREQRLTDYTPDPFQVAIWAKKAKSFDETIKFLNKEHDLPPDERLIDSPIAMRDYMTELEGK